MEQIGVLLEILMINLVLSGDNAVVIAMASKDLPPQQRRLAVWWGSMGAVILRCGLTFVAVIMLKIPYVQALGGMLLLWIAFQLIFENKKDVKLEGNVSIWKAIRTILVADFVMSLDNVLAIAGVANGDLSLIVIGIAFSIPIVVYGSSIIVNGLHRYPILIYIGAGILAYTAGDMMFQDVSFGHYLTSIWSELHLLLPISLAMIVMGAGTFKRMKSLKV
ncbi:MAG TPA: TerC family protein [Paenibacillus sp.]